MTFHFDLKLPGRLIGRYENEKYSDTFNNLFMIHFLRLESSFAIEDEIKTVQIDNTVRPWKEFWNEIKEIHSNDSDKATNIFWNLLLSALSEFNYLARDNVIFEIEKIHERFYSKILKIHGCQYLIPIVEMLYSICGPKRVDMGNKLFKYCVKGDRIKVYRLLCKFAISVRIDKVNEYCKSIQEPLEKFGDKIELDYFFQNFGQNVNNLNKTKGYVLEAKQLMELKNLESNVALKNAYLDQLFNKEREEVAETILVDFSRFRIFKREIEFISILNSIKVIIEKSDALIEEKQKLVNECKIIICGAKDVKKSLTEIVEETTSSCSCLALNRISNSSVANLVSKQINALAYKENPLKNLYNKRMYEILYRYILENSTLAFTGVKYGELVSQSFTIVKKMADMSYSTYNSIYTTLESI